jgi:hypothetical protein
LRNRRQTVPAKILVISCPSQRDYVSRLLSGRTDQSYCPDTKSQKEKDAATNTCLRIALSPGRRALAQNKMPFRMLFECRLEQVSLGLVSSPHITDLGNSCPFSSVYSSPTWVLHFDLQRQAQPHTPDFPGKISAAVRNSTRRGVSRGSLISAGSKQETLSTVRQNLNRSLKTVKRPHTLAKRRTIRRFASADVLTALSRRTLAEY